MAELGVWSSAAGRRTTRTPVLSWTSISFDGTVQRTLLRCHQNELENAGHDGVGTLIRATVGYVGEFATMMRELRGDLLEGWMCSIEASDLSALHSLVVGIRRDQTAVTAGLTLHWNSGPVEGQVNRIKMLKRTMFGRAKFDLLRCRILNRT